jgi:putative transcriptional regulator
MIKHHPTEQMMQQYVQGLLPASLSVAISAHVELCECCANKVSALELQNSKSLFVDDTTIDFDDDMSDLISMITSDDILNDVKPYISSKFSHQNKEFVLPRAIAGLERSNFSQIGKLSRARIDLDDGELRASLLQIDAGGEIPNHTHTGFEVTLLLDGEFEDESGKYTAGDFIWLDGRHSHTPKTETGCLCFTLANSALHFNKGISKLLNPIGNLIY